MKKMIIIILSAFIAFSPLMAISNYSFAEENQQVSWSSNPTNNIFVAAMKAYAKVNYNVVTTLAFVSYNDPINKACTEFMYNQYKRAAGTLNIDLNQLQNSIKYRVDNNGALQFLYSGSYIQYYNALLRQYMIDHNIDPDGNSGNSPAYRGFLYSDSDKNICYVFEASGYVVDANEATFNSKVSAIGTTYRFNGFNYYSTMANGETSYKINDINYYIRRGEDNTIQYVTMSANANVTDSRAHAIYFNSSGYEYKNGYACIIYDTTNSRLYLGNYVQVLATYNGTKVQTLQPQVNLYNQQSNLHQAAIDVAKMGATNLMTEVGKNAAIDVGVLGGTATEQSDKYLDDDDDSDDDLKTDPDVPDDGSPSFPTPKPVGLPTGGILNPDGNGGFNFNFQMPDFSGFNWGLNFDVSNMPFPFSIPFDIIKFLQVLDSTPTAPRYEIHTTIYNTPVNLDIDLSVFDDGMVIIRNIILAGYCIFLIIATRALFHIY